MGLWLVEPNCSCSAFVRTKPHRSRSRRSRSRGKAPSAAPARLLLHELLEYENAMCAQAQRLIRIGVPLSSPSSSLLL